MSPYRNVQVSYQPISPYRNVQVSYQPISPYHNASQISPVKASFNYTSNSYQHNGTFQQPAALSTYQYK